MIIDAARDNPVVLIEKKSTATKPPSTVIQWLKGETLI
ncbi:uncharacterized protein METZ01_LOCUS492496 [marine metagenome]|uniref:Uncharacterized protein n=1 Tax=marine metagenome TaxID=408172 RepID=A0A383D582_9ZZZZ